MKLLLMTLTFFAIQSQVQAAINCTEYYKRQGAFSFQRYEATDGECYLSGDPFVVPSSLIYRSFLMTGNGTLMVFNSYGAGEGPTMHGARVFYFFPRQVDPDITVENGQVVMQSPSPQISLIFSQDQEKVLGMKGGVIKVASKVSPSNSGGVEFSRMQSLYLDAGFRMGEDPTGVPSRSSKFIDSRGRSCAVKNSEIFSYSADGNPTFKFSDNDLKGFLANRCPLLKVNY